MSHVSLVFGLVLVSSLAVSPQSRQKAPETFSANAHVVNPGQGAATTIINVHVDQYTRDADRDKLLKEFASGGAAALTAALRKAPAIGYVEVGSKKWPIHFARATETAKERSIIAVVTEPIFFVGGGTVNAKPREGYDVAVVQFVVDQVGLGSGTLAAAARLKAGTGPAGLELQDYAENPIKLVSVSRLLK